MSFDPIYEDIDPETGEAPASAQNAMMKKALEPKTPLQTQLLGVSKASRFANTSERARWRALEKKAQGADADSRLFYAWLEHAIQWGVKKNTPRVVMPYTSVISYAENKTAAANWMTTNRTKVLKKKTASEMAEVLEAKEQELDALYNED